MSDTNLPKAYEIAGALGAVLEREGIQDCGVALGLVLGQFVLLLERTDDGISEAIDAIAGDAKHAAIKLRNLRQ